MPNLKGKRKWEEDEIVVLCGIYACSSFSIGDDDHDECKLIAHEIGRSPGTVDRQWRNIKDYLAGLPCKKVGISVKYWASILLQDPQLVKRFAHYLCERNNWDLKNLLRGTRNES